LRVLHTLINFFINNTIQYNKDVALICAFLISLFLRLLLSLPLQLAAWWAKEESHNYLSPATFNTSFLQISSHFLPCLCFFPPPSIGHFFGLTHCLTIFTCLFYFIFCFSFISYFPIDHKLEPLIPIYFVFSYLLLLSLRIASIFVLFVDV